MVRLKLKNGDYMIKAGRRKLEEVLKGCEPFARVIPSHFKENGGDGHHMVTWSHGHPNLFKLDHIICFTFYNQL